MRQLTFSGAQQIRTLVSSRLVDGLDSADDARILRLAKLGAESLDDVVRPSDIGRLSVPLDRASVSRVIEAVLRTWVAVDVDDNPEPVVRSPLNSFLEVVVLYTFVQVNTIRPDQVLMTTES